MGSYQIVYNGIMLAMDKQEVVEAFSRLFKLAPEKAAAILEMPRTVIRRNLDSATAEMYREKLLAIGVDVDVRDTSVRKSAVFPVNRAEALSAQPLVLELSPVEDKSSDDEDAIARYHGNRLLDFDFYGSGTEYFRIWIVNVFLTVLTLGVYSAWATVRTRQYFYRNTKLANTPFKYQAAAVEILPGRVICAVLLAFYVGLQWVSETAALMSLLLLLCLLPALLVMSFSCRLQFASWRGVPFSFTRDFPGVYKIVWLPLFLCGGMVTMTTLLRDFRYSAPDFFGPLPLCVLAFCLGFPYWQFALHRFLVSHAAYGNEIFRYPSSAGSYYKLYFLKLPALLLLLLLLTGSVLFVGMGDHVAEQLRALASLWRAPSAGIIVTPELGSYVAASIVALLLVVGLCWLAACLQSSLFNMRYHGLALGKSELSSDARVWPLLWLYLGNTVAILLSAGLLVPWAKVRVLRYRLSSLVLYASYELDDIVDAARRGSATGAEIPDLFTVDIAP